MPIAFVLLNSDLGSDDSVITGIREILDAESAIEYEVLAVYGVYDVILKLTSGDADLLRTVITNRIRRISKVQSTLTMMVIEEQGRS